MEDDRVPPSFTEFDEKQRAALLRFAMALTGDFHMAEDLVADALGRAFEQWSRIGPMQNPTAYVRRIIVNDHISWRRRWKRATPGPLPDRPVRAEHTPEDYERRERLAELLSRLTRRQRTAVVLRYYLDLPVPEIADHLHCTAATVRSHLSHAMRTLRIDAGVDTAVRERTVP